MNGSLSEHRKEVKQGLSQRREHYLELNVVMGLLLASSSIGSVRIEGVKSM